MLCQFLLCSKVNSTYTYIPSFIPSFFGFPSHLGHHRALSSLNYTVGSHQLPILYIVPTVYGALLIAQLVKNLPAVQETNNVCVSVSMSQSISSPSPRCPYICSLLLCLYFCFANEIIYTIFVDSTYMHLIYDICFFLSDLLHSV